MTQPIKDQLQEASTWIRALREEIARVIVGQEALVERLIVALLANGHVLLEGVPGLAKTLSVRTLAAAIQASFHRIQFTPDLLPADIVGTLIYNPQDGKYHATTGPVFANFVLADEINRAPAKVQSALLEAMQERQVTLGGQTMHLPSPFLVLATENPIDQEGTYPLPEAQVDRFMFKVLLDYPSFAEERRILDRMAFTSPETQVKPVIAVDDILKTRKLVDQIHVDEKLRDYVVKLTFATRKPEEYKLDLKNLIQFGASPRATIYLTLAAKAWALVQGREYVIPEDVKSIGPDVLRHRIILTYEADAQGVTTDAIIKKVLNAVPFLSDPTVAEKRVDDLMTLDLDLGLEMTPTELLESVRRVEVRTNRLVNDMMVGAYLSHFKGRGMDFEELREYMPGDDVRDIDWNVTHRMGRPFVKRFREERELAVVLAVDISGSSAFGSGDRNKREFAAEVAATLAVSAAKNGDKVALLLFTDQTELFLPPRKGRRHILRIVRELLAFRPAHRGTDIPAALASLNHILNRRAIVFLLTDFLHTGWSASFGGATTPEDYRHPSGGAPRGASPATLKRELQPRDVIAELGLTNTRHDVVCLHLHDPREGTLPDAGLVTIEDAETDELLELDSTRGAVRDRFAATNAERLADLDRALNRAGVDTLRLNTTEMFAHKLQRFFEIRRGRRRG